LADDAAKPDPPKSPAAVQAQAAYDAAVKRAKEADSAAVAAARQKLLRDLKAAMATAGSNGAVDEVSRIAEAIKRAQGDEQPAAESANTQTFKIFAAKDWQPTITARAGQRIEIKASGTWCYNTNTRGPATVGARGLKENYSWAYLEARVGDAGAPFAIGEETVFARWPGGVIQMRMRPGNDTPKDGFLVITIKN
jgi:hypothetical protein